MPALALTSMIARAAANTNSTASDAVKVVCVWPLSDQYGPGSRFLYYLLVAACLVARKTDWLRKACLAAALLLPAVASLHALVLCSTHVNGAVDMDIYGAFQLCSIGILAAPLTVRLSRTYFFDPGRNIIFLWTGFILAGLLALAVEFYRVTPTDCDIHGYSTRNPKQFPYDSVTCNITCALEKGPNSPIRSGPGVNIGIIPVPNIFTFNAGMLLAAACCLPAILSLVFTLDKILDINWKTRFGDQDEDPRLDELIEGTNGATVGKMKDVNSMVRFLLSVIEIPLFVGAVLAILIIGEINFFSPQLTYLTEPNNNVGQWGPITNVSLATLGSLYLLLTRPEAKENEATSSQTSSHHCNCSHSHNFQPQPTLTVQSENDYSPQRSIAGLGITAEPQEMEQRLSHESGITSTSPNGRQRRASPTSDPGGRRWVARTLKKTADYLGSAAHDKFDMSAYNQSEAREFPEIPGEAQRNPELSELKRQYSRRRDAVLREENSRGGSPVPSASSASGTPALGVEISSSPPPDASSFTEQTRGRPSARRDTLTVPSPAFHRP
ncbi:hypothetical protein K458DRAFT_427591 [Lentithecium fluviatile CBS 122367]|uniref:Uncharacterized protein n=1 Tax=Lentithecium fluviatile CBS 122367 TaxID=1168545 RepID=A0A6G1JG31_9PLEO|nr:hypothetical protein K458DRAFT_427591 [Lentithecium fluviatile CBS 122367]